MAQIAARATSLSMCLRPRLYHAVQMEECRSPRTLDPLSTETWCMSYMSSPFGTLRASSFTRSWSRAPSASSSSRDKSEVRGREGKVGKASTSAREDGLESRGEKRESSEVKVAAKVNKTATRAERIVSGMSNLISTSSPHASIPTGNAGEQCVGGTHLAEKGIAHSQKCMDQMAQNPNARLPAPVHNHAFSRRRAY